MGAGRKPKSTAMKELEGNPGKRKLNKKEPIPGKGIRRFHRNYPVRSPDFLILNLKFSGQKRHLQ